MLPKETLQNVSFVILNLKKLNMFCRGRVIEKNPTMFTLLAGYFTNKNKLKTSYSEPYLLI